MSGQREMWLQRAGTGRHGGAFGFSEERWSGTKEDELGEKALPWLDICWSWNKFGSF
jgi:hypothetical protein